MKQNFYRFPVGVAAEILDDAVAMSVMDEMGVLDAMSRESALAGNVAMCIAERHPTHWLLCARHWDNPDPNENGFQIRAYPKDSVKLSQVEALLKQYLAGATELSERPFAPKPRLS